MKWIATAAFLLVLCTSTAFSAQNASSKDDASLIANSIAYAGENFYSLLSNTLSFGPHRVADVNFEQGGNFGGNSSSSQGAATGTSKSAKRVSEIIGEKIKKIGVPQSAGSQPKSGKRVSEIIGEKVEIILAFIENHLSLTDAGSITAALFRKGERNIPDTDETGVEAPPSGGKGGKNTTGGGPKTNTCANGKYDTGESDIDCGGACKSSKCGDGLKCTANSDCTSGLCYSGICVAQNTINSTNSTCTNGIYDIDESDVDCGGMCATKCAIGLNCTLGSDCASGICSSGKCIEQNATLNGTATCNHIKFDGSTQNHVNIVLVPSGFDGNMTFFEEKARFVASIFSNYEPLSSSIPKLNVMFVPQEAGSYCYFNCSGIDRLLCCDPLIARNISSACTAGLRQTVVIHNSTKYGGAGYTSADLATASIHSSAPFVAVHELGHSLFDLGDEYSYGYSGPSFYNCDYASCPKWADIIGYNGVSCRSNACQGGQYFTSENTIMYALAYNFEEVNLRYSCCTYGRETGTYPSYCSQFQNLNQYCSLNITNATQMSAPYEYHFVKGEDGSWRIDSMTVKLPGAYPAKKAGKVPGGKRVIVTRGNGAASELTVDSEQDIEYPGEYPNMGGHAKMPLRAFSIVIDHLPGKVQSILIDNQVLQVS